MITGIHHICIRCENEEDEKNVRRFYGEVLGMPVKRQWGGGIMFDTGCGLIEVFLNRDNVREAGAVQHFALATDDPDEVISRVRDAGFEVISEPRDVEMPTDPPFPIRVAFCTGPVGETIEIFHER